MEVEHAFNPSTKCPPHKLKKLSSDLQRLHKTGTAAHTLVPMLLQQIKWEPGDGKSSKLTGQLAWCALQGIARVPVCNNE